MRQMPNSGTDRGNPQGAVPCHACPRQAPQQSLLRLNRSGTRQQAGASWPRFPSPHSMGRTRLEGSPPYNPAMVSFRAVLLWLMMLAVPFQAYAAAVMTLCGPDASRSAAVSAPATDDHHASHATAENSHHAAQVDTHQHQDDDGGPDQHRCGNCAPCHGVGLTPSFAAIDTHSPPQADLVEPLYPPASVTPSVPHKPPRA